MKGHGTYIKHLQNLGGNMTGQGHGRTETKLEQRCGTAEAGAERLEQRHDTAKGEDAEKQIVTSQSLPGGTEVDHGCIIEVTLIDEDASLLGRY